ncbi:hypothetical protein FACS1894190_02200 [Spirochaetia bacterium]|nr:hypothetical protein FACS1894190_02200 [Spirochaetia bacterium]
MLRIKGTIYHLEAQINFDADMMIRVFEYGYDTAVLKKTYEGKVRTLEFPQARVIYLETDAKTPESQILRLKFPGKPCYDYEVINFDLLKHTLLELEKQGFAILLPFYVLKLRKQVKKAKNSEERKALSKPLKSLVSDLMDAVDHCKAKGKIDEADVPPLMDGLERLYHELFSRHKELAEGDIMLQEKLDTYLSKKLEYYEDKFRIENSIKVAKKLLADGMSAAKVAKYTELPLKTIKALQSKHKVA